MTKFINVGKKAPIPTSVNNIKHMQHADNTVNGVTSQSADGDCHKYPGKPNESSLDDGNYTQRHITLTTCIFTIACSCDFIKPTNPNHTTDT